MNKKLGASMMALSALGCAFESNQPGEDQDIRSVEQKAISADVFDCNEGGQFEDLACQMLLARVNAELDANGITIDEGGILYTYDDPTDQKIPTGHSCSTTAKVTHKHAEARISSDTRLDVEGKDLRDPFAIKLAVPVELSAKVDVTQRFGARFLGSCSNYARDSYNFRGSLRTTADLVAGFALNPSFGTTSDGDFAMILRPEAAVASELQNTNINFSVNGVSPITPAWTFISGFSSTLARATTAAFTGDSVGDVFASTAAWDFGAPIALSLLGGPAQDILWDLIEDRAAHRLQREAQGFGSELENSLTRELQRALRTDADGTRTFVIDRNYVTLLQQEGVLDDILKPEGRNLQQECRESANQLCNSCRGCSRCVEQQRHCSTLPTFSITETVPAPTRPVPPPSGGGSSSSIPSGASCQWQPFTGAGGFWGSVEVSRAVGSCQEETREIYYRPDGSYDRTVYR